MILGKGILLYLSILSGPALACAMGSLMCLVPLKNVLKYPDYWYEDIIVRIVSAGSLQVCQILVEAEIWCNFELERRLPTYLGMIALGFGMGFILSGGYFYIWTVHHGLSQPGALNHFINGMIVAFVLTPLVWKGCVYLSFNESYISFIISLKILGCLRKLLQSQAQRRGLPGIWDDFWHLLSSLGDMELWALSSLKHQLIISGFW